MTAVEEVNRLYRLFPGARELAVSRELAERYEAEMTTERRYTDNTIVPPSTLPPQRLLLPGGGAILVHWLGLVFKGAYLVFVEEC